MHQETCSDYVQSKHCGYIRSIPVSEFIEMHRLLSGGWWNRGNLKLQPNGLFFRSITFDILLFMYVPPWEVSTLIY
jgi:hypothetical protein